MAAAMVALALLSLLATLASATPDWRMLDQYPNHYVAHKLATGETIEIDGKLDDEGAAAAAAAAAAADAEPFLLPLLHIRLRLSWPRLSRLPVSRLTTRRACSVGGRGVDV